MDVSDSIDKAWDHPWTTEEMRKKRREWSLAGDVGLLKHLQQFSENLVSKANKTQAALDTLTTQLKETGILVDNVTNTSLALANTQFIESRVQEDDIEIKESPEEKQQNVKTQESVPESLLASISQSVKQGLNIMDEKYKMMDVACSDSEEDDDDDGAVVVSVMVGPNDPYQDRPLPYVIGSEKWTTSSKIGLESSSSESEQPDEEREESASDKEEDTQKVFNNPEINIARLSSASSTDSDNYNGPSSNISYINNSKVDALSQNNINSASESVTPNTVSKTSNEAAPNFAEELAKRLGTVRQAQKPVTVDETNESSINRFKDDLFTSKRDDDVFNDGSDNLFSDKKGFFDEQVSTNLWKDRPIKSYKSNIIPASIDVPPPISIVSTKPKSAIDDLFADADSEEDSDDIFSSKNIVKKRAMQSLASDNAYQAKNAKDMPIPKKFLDVVAPGSASGNIATSTPETHVNVTNLFSDEENDDGDLFGVPKKQPQKSVAKISASAAQDSSKKKPVGGVSILRHIVASDIESKLSSQMMRRQSSSSSDSDAPRNDDSARNTESVSAEKANLNDNIATERSSAIAAENPTESISTIIENSNSSGVSMQPPSIDNTVGSGLWVNFTPDMCSTRLKSEEIYRERVTSDSLFTARTRNPANFNSASANANGSSTQQQQSSRHPEQQNTSSALQDDVFENDDLFGPPPLPSKSNSKRVKSKVSSLFDDSDSGDELFSAASSGSRSQKSTDFLATAASADKTKPAPRGAGLFDDDVDIFGGKDVPDVDLFGATSKLKSKDAVSDSLFDSRGREPMTSKSSNINKLPNTRMESKKISLFDDDGDDGDLFGAKPTSKPKPKIERKADFFDDEDDLFLSTKASSKGRSSVEKDALVEPKNDVSKDVSIFNVERKSRDASPGNKLFSSAAKTHSLLFEDDDYDDLFGRKGAVACKNDETESESKEKAKEDLVEEVKELPEENKSSTESPNVDRDVKTAADLNVVVDRPENDVNPEECKTDVEEDVDSTAKKSPPKTLSIRTTSSPPEDGSQTPRRSVSGKIKNLMGKMGDLKILSPMDAPPLWRRSDDRTDEDEDIVDKDSDGPTIAGRISPPSVSEGSTQKESSYSTISTASNAEIAINFDDLVQVETLSTTASKSRVRIQAKRRPQSRHARKSALRHSGIDFDTVDNADDSQEESHTSTFSHTSSKESAVPIASTDRLNVNDNAQRMLDANTDDKSELGSVSKESSMSVNKNTLLSPSTDEEDLFDVPPDLPEDPQKEDTLFGRAPILSPIGSERSEQTSVTGKSLMDTVMRNVGADESAMSGKSNNEQNSGETTRSDRVDSKLDTSESCEKKDEKRRKEMDDELDNEAKRESAEEPSDPLRDSSHDPLKNPSQLFAFVTKTPSPDKGKGLLFAEDDSLFSRGVKKPSDERPQKQKEILDLFADDAGGDLFSAPLKRTVKKPLRDTKISLFDDDDERDDEDDSLFGSASMKTRFDAQRLISAQTGREKNIFDDDDDDDSSLFVESSSHSQKSDSASISESRHDLADTAKSSNLKNIFGNDAPYDDDDDIFAIKRAVPKKAVPSKSLFASDDDDDDGHIFGKPSAASEDLKPRTVIANSRPAVKKPITRDLKKTAEKIVEDPLSLLQDD